MLSILVDDAQLITGSIAVREVGGLGVLGSLLPTGAGVPGYMTDTADLPADNNLEFRGEVLSHTFPANTFEWYDDGSFKVAGTCPAGTYSFTWRPTVEGLNYSLVTHIVIVGSSGALTISAGLSPISSALSMMVVPPTALTITANVDNVISALSLGVPIVSDLSLAATLDETLASIALYGGLPAGLPSSPAPGRTALVVPDNYLDPYWAAVPFRATWEKDPQAELDYWLDLSQWLQPGDPIANMFVTNSAGLVVPVQGVVDNFLGIVAKGGVVGVTESATIRWVTQQGRVDERTIYLFIRDR